MWRAPAATLILVACAHAPASTLTQITTSPTLHGDFDGDGHADSASFFENDEGALIVGVQRAASGRVDGIWGGDISSLERFTIRVAPPRRYTTACALYGTGCVGDVPESVNLTHEGIFVEGLEDNSLTLYYWSDGAFKNVSLLRLGQ